MNSNALILMLMTQITVVSVTAYFFWKVLKTPPKKEPDSFEDNNDIKR